MRINKHNLTIVSHCASKDMQGRITNGLQFTDKGTIAINGAYAVSVTALQVVDKEPVPLCVNPEYVKELLKDMKPEGADISISDLPRMAGSPARILKENKPAAFEIYLNADFLLKIARSVRDFCEPTPDEDSVVRIQFTGENEPVRMEARNIWTGQKWEAILMPRKPAIDAERFVEPASPHPTTCQIPPPPPVNDDLAAALALVAQLSGK